MTRSVIAASLLALSLALPSPSSAAVVEGTVESVSGTTAMVRSDDGGVFTVDLSGVGAAARGHAATGQHVTVEGNYTQAVTFVASSVSPGVQGTTGTPTIHGTVESVNGKTIMVHSYDGGVFTVDGSQLASLPSLRVGDAVTVTGNYHGGVTIAAQDIRPSPQRQDSARAGRQGWQRVHGTVDTVQDSTLTFRSDDGRTLSVDTSRVGQGIRRNLRPGDGATVIGVPGSSANLFTARYIQEDSSDRSRAGQRQPLAASPAFIEGTVESVSATTAMVRSDDGGVFTVDLSGLGAAARRPAMPGRRVIVAGNYTQAVTVVASSVATGIQKATGAPAIYGTVGSVNGKTLMVHSNKGGVFTVDASQVAALPAVRPGDTVTVTGNYAGGVTMTAQELREAPNARDRAQAGGQTWQRVHGTVESVRNRAVTFRTDDGRTLNVDVSAVSENVRRGLTQGESATVVGFPGSNPNRFTAHYIQQDSSDRSRTGRGGQPAASPTTTK